MKEKVYFSVSIPFWSENGGGTDLSCGWKLDEILKLGDYKGN
jgi:hypothetical protein